MLCVRGWSRVRSCCLDNQSLTPLCRRHLSPHLQWETFDELHVRVEREQSLLPPP